MRSVSASSILPNRYSYTLAAGISTSGYGLAKLMPSIEPWPSRAASPSVELPDQLLGRHHPKRRVDELTNLGPVDLLRRGEIQPEPAERTHVRGEEEATVLLECSAVAVVDLHQDRVRELDVGALGVGLHAAAVHHEHLRRTEHRSSPRHFLERLGEAQRELAHLRETGIVVAEHDRVRHSAKLRG